MALILRKIITLKQILLFFTKFKRVTYVCVHVNKISRLNISMSIISQF